MGSCAEKKKDEETIELYGGSQAVDNCHFGDPSRITLPISVALSELFWSQFSLDLSPFFQYSLLFILTISYCHINQACRNDQACENSKKRLKTIKFNVNFF